MLRAVRHWRITLYGLHVHLWCDNQVAVGWIRSGRPPISRLTADVPHLLWDLFDLIEANAMRLTVEYIPSRRNYADGLSRLPVERREYSFRPADFWRLAEAWWGPPVVWRDTALELFAFPQRNTLKHWCSRYPWPECLGDAFQMVSWDAGPIWAFPP